MILEFYLYHVFAFALVTVVFLQRQKIHSKYEKLKTMYWLIWLHHGKLTNTLYIMSSILAKTLYFRAMQSLNKSVVQTGKNTYELTYTVCGNLYKMVIRAKRGPRKLINAFNAKDVDITELLQMYVGPNNDFHNQDFTPDFFDTDSITVHLSNGDEKTFQRYDLLQF